MVLKLKQAFIRIAADRFVLGLMIAMVALALLVSVYVGLTVRPSEVQVVTHYTSFGPTNFYRTRWYYLISFAIFGVFYAFFHAVIAAKLYVEKDRSFSVGFLWLSIGLIVVAFALIVSIINIATL